MVWNIHRKGKVEAVRQEVAESALDGDRKVLVQDFLNGADRCLSATTQEEKLDAVVSGQSDIITYLARDAVRSERVMNAKITACEMKHKYNFGWPAFMSLLAIITTVLGIMWRLGLLG